MKRIYTILSCLLLVGMLCIGLYALLDKDATYSESERRKLKTRPKLTFSACSTAATPRITATILPIHSRTAKS